MIKNIITANLYELQPKFDEVATKFRTEHDIDKETFAQLCLDWVRENAKWDEHQNTTDRKVENPAAPEQPPQPPTENLNDFL